jgi:uncharacterized membrane protein
MSKIHKSIEVEVPVATAYNQWTQFEEFPNFMEGVEEVRQLDDTHLQWVASVGGKRNEWKAEITEQKPDERVAWRSTEGKDNAGVITFESLGEARTKVIVNMEFEPEGVVETLGSAVGADDRRVEGDLARFKEMIESRGVESGEWRGHVTAGDSVQK